MIQKFRRCRQIDLGTRPNPNVTLGAEFGISTPVKNGVKNGNAYSNDAETSTQPTNFSEMLTSALNSRLGLSLELWNYLRNGPEN